MKCDPRTRQLIGTLSIALICFVFGIAEPLLADSGAAIYQHGKTEAGKVFIGTEENEAPATLFPCINCHGDRGTGLKEAGIVAPNITWSQLTQSYRKNIDGGKTRAPYTLDSFKKALVAGVNSDDEKLSNIMPRYLLTDAEIRSLIVYLSQIEQRTHRGVEDTKIHFWLRLPENPKLADVIRDTVSAFASDINDRGGIYRRQLLLQEYTAAEANASAFCILDLRMLGMQDEDFDTISLGIFASDSAANNTYFLYNHPATFHKFKTVLAEDNGWDSLQIDSPKVDDIINKLKELDETQINSTALIHRPKSVALEHVIEALMDAQISPVIVTDSLALSLRSRQFIAQYPASIFVLNPPGPESVSLEGQQVFSKLAQTFKFSRMYLPAKLWSLALMKVLVTALEQSGKNLTQDAFVETLQRQVNLDTGFGPALSYSANRRVGNIGAILVQIN